MTVVSAEFLKEGFEAPDYVVVDRPKIGGIRYYLIKRGEEFFMFPGVTSVLKHLFGDEPELVKWKATYPGGLEAARKYGELRADYGSTMHAMVSEITKKPFETQEEFETQFRIILSSYGRDYLYDDWIKKAKRDMNAWLKWYKDYNVEPIFSELPLVSFEHKIAGQVDYLCRMDAKDYGGSAQKRFEGASKTLSGYDLAIGTKIQEGRLNLTLRTLFNALHDMGIRDPSDQRDRLVQIAGENVVPYLKKAYHQWQEKLKERNPILALPDWKFANSIAYESQARQIGIYNHILMKENYPDLEIHEMYNWRPTDWKKAPSYEFKARNASVEYIDHIMGLFKHRPMKDKWMTAFTGGYKPGEIPGMERLPALEYFKQKYLDQQENMAKP